MSSTSPFTETKRERWEAEGRGTGEGDSWIAWVQWGDFSAFSKQGIDSLQAANGRLIHALSQQERWAYLVYSSKRTVLGIEEQYPLPRELTRKIARSMGIVHPRDPDSRVDIVVTSDLMIREAMPDGSVRRHARSVKPSSHLPDHNHMEHAELERRANLALGHTWGLVTEQSFTPALLQNVDMLYLHRDVHNRSEPLGYEGSFEAVADEVMREILASRTDAPLFKFCTALNNQRGWPPATATSVAVNLCRHHRLRIDYCGQPLGSQSVLAIAQATRAMQPNPALGRAA